MDVDRGAEYGWARPSKQVGGGRYGGGGVGGVGDGDCGVGDYGTGMHGRLRCMFVRYVLRLFGLPAAIYDYCTASAATAGRGVAVEWKDRCIHALEKLDGASMVLYHPLEHVALGGWMVGDAYPGLVDGGRWSAWSCWAWLVFIIAEWAGRNRELGGISEGCREGEREQAWRTA